MDLREKLGGAPHSKQSLRVWLRLLSCSNVIERRIRKNLAREFGTTLPRFDVLSALDRAPGGLTMSALSGMLMVSNGNVTGLVNRLINDGLVARRVDKNDRRTFHVRLTDEGRRAFDKMARRHEEWMDEMFAELDTGQIEGLHQALGALRRSVAHSEGKYEQ